MVRYLLGTVFILLSYTVIAQGDLTPVSDPTELKQGIEKMAQNTSTIQASFTQNKYLSILSNKLVSNGSLYFKKPQHVKWAYEKPYEYVIVLDGKQISISDEGKVNTFDVSSSKVFQQVNSLIVSSVRGDILQEDQFNISYFKSGASYVAKLVPKDANIKEYLSEIEVHFNKEDFSVDQLLMIEPSGDYTDITFNNKKLNQSLSDGVFSVQ
tara:strand:- start:683 stop:1315 length:633 start_codon:yes stop_codon:yes gene_type:complete